MGYSRPGGNEAGVGRVAAIRRTLWIILVLNVGVALAKLLYGMATRSAAMQADGFHSLFDGTSNVVGLIGMGMAGRPADRDHPYGHSKYETYASAVIGAMLLFAAYRIGSTALSTLTGGGEPARVDVLSFVVMIATLVVNIFITTWERRVGRKLGSEILIADASHTLSDAYVSVGVIIGLVFVRFGYPKADPIVALLVAGAILWTAWGVFKQASATLSDSARVDPAGVCACARKVPGVLGCHHVRSRGSEASVYVDLHIQVDPSITVAEGHSIAESVERTICAEYPTVADVLAHLEPLDAYQQAKTTEEMGTGLA